MAELSPPDLIFDGTCPDCGERRQILPLPLPPVEDDFDWKVRDYDSFRLFMMQELASRYRERRRWTPADMEVVLVEVLSAALDRMSHALDRVQAERYLDTARRPESVRRLLQMIGWRPDTRDMAEAETSFVPPPEPGDEEPPLDPYETSDAAKLEQYWRRFPAKMEAARAEGPRLIGEQNRMVTLPDHAETLERHPFVALARARLVWSGAWQSILVSTLLEDALPLDAPLHDSDEVDPARPNRLRPELWEEILQFHSTRNISLPPIDASLSGRSLLRPMIEQYRLIGTEVFLEAARPAPISVVLSIRAKAGYFRSELKQAVAAVFTSDQGGFFEPGRLGFGVPLYASDIIDAAMSVEGVAVACLNLLRRIGDGFEDRTADGVIEVDDDEFIQCLNQPRAPEKGMLRLTIQGGETG